jgi:hypothetical protein
MVDASPGVAAPDKRDEFDFLIAEFNSMRQELASRWTMLYALGTLSWAVVAGSLAVIYAAPGGPFYPLALFVVPVVLILGLIFGGEVAWMAALHRSCANIESAVQARLPIADRDRFGTLLWHTKFGTEFRSFPGALATGLGASLLFFLSIAVLVFYPFGSALSEVGWSGLEIIFAQIAVVLSAVLILGGSWIHSQRVQSL